MTFEKEFLAPKWSPAKIWNDLLIPPGNKLEKLKGKLAPFCSIRINDQWRIIFKWDGSNAHEVKIIDYH